MDMKRYIVVRNGRGIIAEGNDMAELESGYTRAAQTADTSGERERGMRHDFPRFDTLTPCDHEGETGKVCILDSEDAPDAAKSYYNVGFVD